MAPSDSESEAMRPVRQVGALENGVLVGRNRHLFLAGGGHSVLDFASGSLRPASSSLRNFNANVVQRELWSRKRGANYVHVVFPDKQSVLTSDFPQPDPVCLGELYLAHVKSAQEHVFYPRDLLRQQAENCFLHTDTHLTDFASSLIAGHLAQRLSRQLNAEAAMSLLPRITARREHCGDLGLKLSPPESSQEMFFSNGWPAKSFSNRLSGNNGLVDLWFRTDAPSTERVLIFGDSFGRDLSKALSYLFAEVLFLRTPFYHLDIASQFQPNIIMSENVERYLSHVTSDEERPSFFMLPFLKSGEIVYKPDAKFAEAFSAALSFKRAPYRKFVASLSNNEMLSK